MNGVVVGSAAMACLCGGAASACAARLRLDRKAQARRREAAYGRDVARAGSLLQLDDMRSFGLRYAEQLTRRLYTGSTMPLSPAVRAGRASSTRPGQWYARHSLAAGCAKSVSSAAYCEARIRLGIVGALAGLLFGVAVSNELGILLGLLGAVAGGSIVKRSIDAARKSRAVCAQQHLSEMLEVVALGLRSGLTFDRSFALYGSHFQNPFAQSCALAYQSWALGIVSREDALHKLAQSYESEQLKRVVDSVMRSLKFGSALTGVFEEAASQSRAAYRAELEERVAKAPVKMMLPTGALILPAMLLMVMGPILLEFMGGAV